MCTSLVKEIIGYYHNHSSVVYACLVDAIKAFDRLNYGKLFQLMHDREMPKVIIRLIFQNYLNQNFFVKWGSVTSYSFNKLN